MIPLGAALATAACARLPPCPANGGPTWSEWQTPHFRLATDLSEEDAEALAENLEHTRAALLAAAWRHAPEPMDAIAVVAFHNFGEASQFLVRGSEAMFVSGDVPGTAFVVVAGSSVGPTLTHELVHALAWQYARSVRMPRWLEEGLAQYLETLRFDQDDTIVAFGEPDPTKVRLLGSGIGLPFDDLWSSYDDFTMGRFYVTSWLLVHYLFNHEAARFDRYQHLLATGSKARDAWNEVFPDLTGDAVDLKLATYLDGGQYASFRLALPAPHFGLSAAVMSDAQVHALRGLLFASGPAPRDEKPALVRGEVRESLRQEPFNVLALVVERLFLHDHIADLDVPTAVTTRMPDEPAGWLLLAKAHEARRESAQAASAMNRWQALATRRGLVETRRTITTAKPY